ncbi:MAG: AbrB/MazE/SpoVT family DNA-binding domain-containing protein [Oceanipulchritudo sp.]
MLTKVSSKGQTVIPAAIREMARIRPGDELEVGCSNGLVVMRKRQALTPARVRQLLKDGYRLPEITEADELAVAEAVGKSRRSRAR